MSEERFSRARFLTTIKHASPALAGDKNQVKELYHLWFDGEFVYAFNDILGIQVECPTDFTGGINGDRLIKFLSGVKSRYIYIEVQNTDVIIALEPKPDNPKKEKERNKLTLKYLPIEDMLWKPVIPAGEVFKVDKPFRDAMDRMLLSVGRSKVLTPEQRGVTFIQGRSEIDMYSTDSITLSWNNVEYDSKVLKDDRCIVPTEFCEQLKEIGSDPAAQLHFGESSIYCVSNVVIGRTGKNEEGKGSTTVKAGAVLFSKLVEDEEPVNFTEIISDYMETERGFSIPVELQESIDGVIGILDDDKQPLQIKIDDEEDEKGKCVFINVEGQDVLYNGVVRLDEKVDHPNIAVQVDAKMLQRGIDGRKKITVTKDCIIMTGPAAFVHIVATK